MAFVLVAIKEYRRPLQFVDVSDGLATYLGVVIDEFLAQQRLRRVRGQAERGV